MDERTIKFNKNISDKVDVIIKNYEVKELSRYINMFDECVIQVSGTHKDLNNLTCDIYNIREH